MLHGYKFLAIIPARGGSKRLPKKNILDLAGKPLIAWTIESALKCPYLDEVMVTTDDEKIAKVSANFGANVPFIRPSALATDESTSFDAIKHSIEFYKNKLKNEFDFIVLLQPTSPLRDASDINNAIQLLIDKNADAIISVCETEHSPMWANKLPDDLSMSKFINENTSSKRSQDLEVYYRLNGAIYICKTSLLMNKGSFFVQNNIYAYVMSRYKSIDIDTYYDFLFAKTIFDADKILTN